MVDEECSHVASELTNYTVYDKLLANYICSQDGYTKEISGLEAVRVRVATKAKSNVDKNSRLDREFFKSFLEVSPTQHDLAGRMIHNSQG